MFFSLTVFEGLQKHFLVSVFAFAAIGGVSCKARKFNSGGSSQVRSDSYVKQPTLDNQRKHADLLATNYPNFVRVEIIGKPQPSATNFEMFLLRFGVSVPRKEDPLSSSRALRPVLYISDATHGDEYTGVVDRLAGYFASQTEDAQSVVSKYLNAGGLIYLVPVVNPSGYEETKRETATEADLNRNFTKEKVNAFPELAMIFAKLRSLLEADGAEIRVTTDYHCCARIANTPVFLRPTNFSDPDRPDKPLQNANAQRYVDEFAEMVKASFAKGAEVGPSAVLLKKDGSDELEKASPGTSKDFFYSEFLEKLADEKFVLAATFEGVRKKKEEKNPNDLKSHWALWNKVLARLTPTSE